MNNKKRWCQKMTKSQEPSSDEQHLLESEAVHPITLESNGPWQRLQWVLGKFAVVLPCHLIAVASTSFFFCCLVLSHQVCWRSCCGSSGAAPTPLSCRTRACTSGTATAAGVSVGCVCWVAAQQWERGDLVGLKADADHDSLNNTQLNRNPPTTSCTHVVPFKE